VGARKKKQRARPDTETRAIESDWRRALENPSVVTTLELDVRQLPAVRFPATRRLPSDIARFVALRELTIHARNLGALCAELGQLPRLATLRIDNAERVLELGGVFAEMRALTTLELYNVGLTAPLDLPPTLERLSVEANGSLDLAAWCRSLRTQERLRALNIGGCAKVDLPTELSLLTPLHELTATQCELARFPDAIFSLPALRELNLANNRIAELDPRLIDLTQLQCLWLKGNPLDVSAPWLSRLKSLQVLGIDQVPDDVFAQLQAMLPHCTIEMTDNAARRAEVDRWLRFMGKAAEGDGA